MVALKKPTAEKGASPAKAKRETKKKDSKSASKNRIAGIKNFFQGVKSELKKVHWPTRRETLVYTGVVLVAVVFVAILIWVLDIILSSGVSFIIR
ncbi:preprotein translocase subunit SecE [Desulfofalx alkaliphila]|uniref:preprotein translocase subunit SecE n=1 Tax=Desulfofalx alkaliphila TaxID=105483 RepID=UPI0004E1664F|nr:preprotein translocase subunit SecE [Desulfofalx alkaliphila]